MEIRTITAPFTDEVLSELKVGDIVNVSGIGAKKLSDILDHITVEDPNENSSS